MFKINKIEPVFFTNSKNKVKLQKVKNAWSDEKIISIKQKLRKNLLLNEQYSLCAYCEKEINSTSLKSNIDHFKKRDIFPQETLSYNNLLASCNNKNRCSSYKDSNKRGLTIDDYNYIINPVLDNPDDYFDYLPTGEIYPKDNLDRSKKKKANFTIDLFQLNEIDLLNERKTIMKSLYHMKNQMNKSDIVDILISYRSFIISVYDKQLTI